MSALSILTNGADKTTPETGAGLPLMLVAGACPVLAVLAPLALVPLVIIMAVGALVAVPRRQLQAHFPVFSGIILGTLVLWGMASAIWTEQPSAALYKGAQLSFLFLAISILIASARTLSEGVRERMGLALAAGFIAAIALLLVERFFQVPLATLLVEDASDKILLLKRYNRGETVLAILLWPAVHAVMRRSGWGVAAGFATAVVATLLLMESRAAMIAVVLGAVIFFIGPTQRRLAMITCTGATLAAFVVPFILPAVVLQREPEVLREQALQLHAMSAMHRMSIWEFTIERIEDRPVLGWGLSYSRHLPEGQDSSAYYGEKMPLHPHNAVLQIQVELGIVGTSLALALALMGIAHAGRRAAHSLATNALLASFLSVLVIASISYGVWQSWWIAAIGLSAAISEAMARDRAP